MPTPLFVLLDDDDACEATAGIVAAAPPSTLVELDVPPGPVLPPAAGSSGPLLLDTAPATVNAHI